MKPVHFKEVNVTLGKGQPEYQELPAQYNDDLTEAPFTFCYELDESELAQIAKTGRIWLKQLTFKKPFQPIQPTIYNPFYVIELPYYKTDIGTVVGMVPLEGGGFDSIPGTSVGNLIDEITTRYIDLKAENFYFMLVDDPTKPKQATFDIISG